MAYPDPEKAENGCPTRVTWPAPLGEDTCSAVSYNMMQQRSLADRHSRLGGFPFGYSRKSRNCGGLGLQDRFAMRTRTNRTRGAEATQRRTVAHNVNP